MIWDIACRWDFDSIGIIYDMNTALGFHLLSKPPLLQVICLDVIRDLMALPITHATGPLGVGCVVDVMNERRYLP